MRLRQASALAGIACLLGALIAGCGEGGTNYTKLSVASAGPRCDRSELSVGEWVEPIISMTNTSGHAWKSTWVWINGTSDNLKLEGRSAGEISVPAISMNDQPVDETFAPASQYNLGPLPAGEVGDIHMRLTAEKAGNPKVLFAVWGNSEAKPTPSIPSDPGGFACSYTIN